MSPHSTHGTPQLTDPLGPPQPPSQWGSHTLAPNVASLDYNNLAGK